MEFVLLHPTPFVELMQGDEKTEDHSSARHALVRTPGWDLRVTAPQQPGAPHPARTQARPRPARQRGPVYSLRLPGHSLEVDKLWSFTEIS